MSESWQDEPYEAVAARSESVLVQGHVVWYFPNSKRCRLASPGENPPAFSVMGLAAHEGRAGDKVLVNVRTVDLEPFRPRREEP